MMKVRMPEWLKKKEIQLPMWAKIDEEFNHDKVALRITVDPLVAYKEWFALLHDPAYPIPNDMEQAGITHMPNVAVPDQYWLEVAYQCTKLDLQMALKSSQFDPLLSGKPVEFNFLSRPELKMTNYPEGKTWQAATQGREARMHYIRVRGSLPM